MKTTKTQAKKFLLSKNQFEAVQKAHDTVFLLRKTENELFEKTINYLVSEKVVSENDEIAVELLSDLVFDYLFNDSPNFALKKSKGEKIVKKLRKTLKK